MNLRQKKHIKVGVGGILTLEAIRAELKGNNKGMY